MTTVFNRFSKKNSISVLLKRQKLQSSFFTIVRSNCNDLLLLHGLNCLTKLVFWRHSEFNNCLQLQMKRIEFCFSFFIIANKDLSLSSVSMTRTELNWLKRQSSSLSQFQISKLYKSILFLYFFHGINNLAFT